MSLYCIAQVLWLFLYLGTDTEVFYLLIRTVLYLHRSARSAYV